MYFITLGDFVWNGDLDRATPMYLAVDGSYTSNRTDAAQFTKIEAYYQLRNMIAEPWLPSMESGTMDLAKAREWHGNLHPKHSYLSHVKVSNGIGREMNIVELVQSFAIGDITLHAS